MVPPKKIKISVRLNRFNYECVRSIADVAFREEGEPGGNFSEALDFLLALLRNNTNFTTYLKLLQYFDRYQKGDRSKEVLDKVKEYTKLINIVVNTTK